MKSFSDINIQKLFPAIIYKRGLEYYKRGKVMDLLYDLNYQVWTATVKGSEDYFVEINMSQFADGSIDTYCDCPAFDTFGSCKHVAATLIGISQKETDRPPALPHFDYQTTNHFIQALTNVPQTTATHDILPEKREMQVQYFCSWTLENSLQLELKAGEKRCYVVKDAGLFLDSVLDGKEHYFTKAFTYSPDQHYFKPEDLAIFETLREILNNEQMYEEQRQFSSFRNSNKDTRYITIPPLAAKALLEELVNRDFTVDTIKKSYHPVEIAQEKLPFQFSLSKNERNELILNMPELRGGTYLRHYHILFSDGVFYFPSKEQIPVVEQVSQFGLSDLQLPITKQQADTFLSEVLPSLKKVGEVEISEKVTEEIIQLPLQAKLYLEVSDNWIVGKLEYYYGEHYINPFGGREEHDIIIIRDVKKEQQIMQLIEYANFKYNGKELYIEAEAEEEIYDFLYYVLPLLDEHLELFLTSEIRSFIMDREPMPNTSVRLESSSNLLEIGFDIEGVKDEEVSSILQAVIEKKRYYRLDSGALLSLEGEEFSSMKQFFQDMEVDKKDLNDGNIHVPVYRGTQVDALIETNKNYDPSFRKLLHQLKSPEEQVYPLPEELQANLRNYQQTGFQWFKSLSHYHLGGILADDMGLGKTLQSIAYIASEPSDLPHLIVAPSSVVYNWKNECEKFMPSLSVAVLTGTPAERRQRLEEEKEKDVWITSYATLRQDIEYYRQLRFQTLILDEAQYIKNYVTKTSQAIREINAGRRFALSGTPIENSIDELWAIFQVVLPGLMPRQREFKQLSNEKIALITRPFILRRLKKDVLKELPDKIESVHVSELTKEQKDLYLGYHRQLQIEAAQSMKESGFQQNRMKILAGLTRLRQICCHPSLFIENYEGQSGKLEQLMDTVRNAIGNGKRMLIFSQFTSMHEIIIQQLEKENIEYFYLNGQTPSQERVKMSERFNNGEKSVFLISLKAGGTGLNLTGADTVILYDLWWNPAVEDQATGRAHRFGQKNVVQVIRLLAEGTIEEKIYELQQKKRELIDQVIQPGETMLSGLSEDDVRELLNI
ncbi:DEAD/DEAH box helicase [Oceanobacillus jordanicus]|uniref:DEAD/DEAH box helicase n=1 Tax=Oceanobacillus jordanicus TaxID=2867266 RepID=A0AAW5AX72_9BACI|nr:DEAD/DEAH box helicase [Oceanobacillus jordanicus]MCG3417820.1 DEAD/DEAH box helicase [Oceanobacillus jordanicus]